MTRKLTATMRGVPAGNVRLECGHTIVVPPNGAVLAHAADIVHHHRICDGFVGADVDGADPRTDELPFAGGRLPSEPYPPTYPSSRAPASS